MDRPIKILLVDDNQDDHFLLERAIRKTGFNIRIDRAYDGVEALVWLRTSAVLPDLILLDLQMPKFSGVELLAELRGDPALQHLSVVILSASDNINEQKRCQELGIDGFETKPMSADDIAELFHRLQLV